MRAKTENVNKEFSPHLEWFFDEISEEHFLYVLLLERK
jgi:hypothetical protein